MKIETQAVHAGRHVDSATGAVTPPIHLSTTFERDADGEYPRGYSYAREDNPNRHALEECLAVRSMAQWVQAERASLWKERSFDSGFALAAGQE